MSRQNPFPATEDSDQSLWDDEDLDGDSSRNCVALSGYSEKERGLQILSQLEKLRDANKADSAIKFDLLAEKPSGFSLVEDEVEIPSFGIEGDFISSLKRPPKCCSDEEMISDDEGNNVHSKFSITSNEKQGEEEPSSLVMKQLVTGLLSGNALTSSSCAVNSKEDQSFGEKLSESENPSTGKDNVCLSYTEKLSESEIPPLEKRRQTLVDCFQAVLDATPWRDRDSPAAVPNPSGFGLFGRLQQVMQNEKERELEFVNNLHTSDMPLCGTSCLHVLILSSYLDARLIVCRCSIEKISEILQEQHSPESASLWRRQGTVIFSPRTCNNVDLEVGKVVCIYPLWKEFRVDDESILLCTCFSRVSV